MNGKLCDNQNVPNCAVYTSALIIYLTLTYLYYKKYKESGFLQTIYVCSAFKNISRNEIDSLFLLSQRPMKHSTFYSNVHKKTHLSMHFV